MKKRIVALVAVGFLVVMAGAPQNAAAQTSDGAVTFSLPLNITNLSPDITKVAVYCKITSSAFNNRFGYVQKQEEYVPQNGQVVTTATVVIPTTELLDPIGKSANYYCTLSAFSNSLQRWELFSETSATPVFRLRPTPPEMSGTFTW